MFKEGKNNKSSWGEKKNQLSAWPQATKNSSFSFAKGKIVVNKRYFFFAALRFLYEKKKILRKSTKEQGQRQKPVTTWQFSTHLEDVFIKKNPVWGNKNK